MLHLNRKTVSGARLRFAPSSRAATRLRSTASPAEAATETHSIPTRFKRPDSLMRFGVTGICLSSLSLSFTSTIDVPDSLRLAIICYWIWAFGEWAVHRYGMHSPSGSFVDMYVHLNSLHVKHHKDTCKDMSMADGYDLNALYFHFPNTLLQSAAGVVLISILCEASSLSIPTTSIVIDSFTSAFLHSLLWNSMHLEMHKVQADLPDGMPALKLDPSLAASFQRWVISNHTIHHDCGRGQNYNVVLPGPDIILGTYLTRGQTSTNSNYK